MRENRMYKMFLCVCWNPMEPEGLRVSSKAEPVWLVWSGSISSHSIVLWWEWWGLQLSWFYVRWKSNGLWWAHSLSVPVDTEVRLHWIHPRSVCRANRSWLCRFHFWVAGRVPPLTRPGLTIWNGSLRPQLYWRWWCGPWSWYGSQVGAWQFDQTKSGMGK